MLGVEVDVESWLVEEWNFFQTARWLGVKPWELLEQPLFWQARGEFYMKVEAGLSKVKVEKHG